MNLRDARLYLSSVLTKDNFLSLVRNKKNYYLTVREINGRELEDIQSKFKIMHMLGQDWDYGDILITMEVRQK